MRNLTMTIVLVFAAAGYVRGANLLLNTAQQSEMPTALVSQESVHYGSVEAAPAGTASVRFEATHDRSGAIAEHVSHSGHGTDVGCRSGGCRQGSLDAYPGGCCEEGAGCCAALWENYCRDKKPCWQPGSPRRHFAGYGIPVPNLHFFHLKKANSCDAVGDCVPEPSCDDDACCDGSALSATDPFPKETSDGASEDSQDVMPPANELPSSRAVDSASLLNGRYAHPYGVDSARQMGLPFGLKLPRMKQPTSFGTSNPFRVSNPLKTSKPFKSPNLFKPLKPLKIPNPFKTASPFRSSQPSGNSPMAGLAPPYSR